MTQLMGKSLSLSCSGSFIYSKIKCEIEEVRGFVGVCWEQKPLILTVRTCVGRQ